MWRRTTVVYATQPGYAIFIFLPATVLLDSPILSCLHIYQTAEHLTLTSLGKSPLESPPADSETGDRQKSTFQEDITIPAPFRAKLQDYFRSGYDRGHM